MVIIINFFKENIDNNFTATQLLYTISTLYNMVEGPLTFTFSRRHPN